MRIIFFLTLMIAAPFMFSTFAFAQRFVVSGDQNYYVTENDELRIIYSAESRPLIQDLQRYSRLFQDVYEKEFSWSLDEKTTLILASSYNQVANGLATSFPRLHTVFYNGGAEIIDEFASKSWLYTLLSHETAHLYQLNVKRGYSQDLKKLFGTTAMDSTAFLPPFTYVQSPSIFLPTFLAEGNATFNEIRFGIGGRLYNGAIRSLFLQMLRNDQITAKRLMNDHIDFPYGREKYWAGGFLQLFLAEKYGSHRANAYFYTHADHKFNPFRVNKSFLESYSVGYEQALQDLSAHWAPLASALQVATEKTLFRSVQHHALTKINDEILFLTTDGRHLPKTHTYQLGTQRWTQQSTNLPIGRLFRDKKGRLASVSSEAVNNHQIRAGLFSDGFSFHTENLDQYLYDQKGSLRLWADAKNSFFSPLLYLQEGSSPPMAIGYAASSGLIGPDGQAYYFKQNGRERTLYRGLNSLFSYPGYYGVPVEIIDANNIYFVGPTQKGTSLFLWSGGRFYRMHHSDAIVDAKLISDASDSGRKKALIVEIRPQNYEYKITNLLSRSEAPYEYNYFIESEPHKDLLKEVAPPHTPLPVPDSTADNAIPNEKPYHPWSEWQFNGVDPFFIWGGGPDHVAQARVRFSDPLGDHNFAVLLGSASHGQMLTGLQYINNKHVIGWDVTAQYQQRVKLEEDPLQEGEYNVLDRYDTWLGSLGFEYPFFVRPQWTSSLNSHFVYENEDPHIQISDIDQKYTLLTQLNTEHSVKPFLAFSPYRLFGLELAHEMIRSAPDWVDPRQIFGGDLVFSHDLFRETYLSARIQEAYTDSPWAIVELDRSPDDFPYPAATRIHRFTEYPDRSYYEVRKVSAQLKQAMNLGLYFTQFPLSLRRFALFAAYNEYYGSTARRTEPETLFHEVGGGLDLELLLLHKFPTRMQILNFKSSYRDDSTISVIFGAQQIF